jgi:hypothetical protein
VAVLVDVHRLGEIVLTLIKGPRGSGKTAWVVRELLTVRRTPIVTNIALGYWQTVHVFRLKDRKWIKERVFVVKPPANVYFVPSDRLTVKYLIEVAREVKKAGKTRIILAVDEGGLKWDSRHARSNPNRLLWNRFYKVSRHFGYDEAYIITQIETAVEKQIRELADVVYTLLNLRAAFPILFGWIPWPWGISIRKFNGLEVKSIRWPFYIIFPWTLHRYNHTQFSDEFAADLKEFTELEEAAERKRQKQLAAASA